MPNNARPRLIVLGILLLVACVTLWTSLRPPPTLIELPPERLLLPIYVDGKWGVIDEHGEEFLPAEGIAVRLYSSPLIETDAMGRRRYIIPLVATGKFVGSSNLYADPSPRLSWDGAEGCRLVEQTVKRQRWSTRKTWPYLERAPVIERHYYDSGGRRLVISEGAGDGVAEAIWGTRANWQPAPEGLRRLPTDAWRLLPNGWRFHHRGPKVQWAISPSGREIPDVRRGYEVGSLTVLSDGMRQWPVDHDGQPLAPEHATVDFDQVVQGYLLCGYAKDYGLVAVSAITGKTHHLTEIQGPTFWTATPYHQIPLLQTIYAKLQDNDRDLSVVASISASASHIMLLYDGRLRIYDHGWRLQQDIDTKTRYQIERPSSICNVPNSDRFILTEEHDTGAYLADYPHPTFDDDDDDDSRPPILDLPKYWGKNLLLTASGDVLRDDGLLDSGFANPPLVSLRTAAGMTFLDMDGRPILDGWHDRAYLASGASWDNTPSVSALQTGGTSILIQGKRQITLSPTPDFMLWQVDTGLSENLQIVARDRRDSDPSRVVMYEGDSHETMIPHVLKTFDGKGIGEFFGHPVSGPEANSAYFVAHVSDMNMGWDVFGEMVNPRWLYFCFATEQWGHVDHEAGYPIVEPVDKTMLMVMPDGPASLRYLRADGSQLWPRGE